MKLETETEVRSKNTPAITDYCHRCRERQQNEHFRDYNFKYLPIFLLVFLPLFIAQEVETSAKNITLHYITLQLSLP